MPGIWLQDTRTLISEAQIPSGRHWCRISLATLLFAVGKPILPNLNQMHQNPLIILCLGRKKKMPESHWFFLNCLFCIHSSIRSTSSCRGLLASWQTCAALSFTLFHMSCVWCQPVVIDWQVRIRMDLVPGCIKTRWLAPSLWMCDPAAAQKSWKASHRHAWFHFQPSWTIPTPRQKLKVESFYLFSADFFVFIFAIVQSIQAASLLILMLISLWSLSFGFTKPVYI